MTWIEEAFVCLRSSRKPAISASRAPGGASRRDQQPAPGHRRERRGDLKLGIVAPAGALVGVGPGVVEHIFALAVALEIAGRGGDDPPARVLDHDMRRRPARSPADRARRLQRVQKGVRDERIEPLALRFRLASARRVGAGVPRRRVDGGEGRDDARGEGRHCVDTVRTGVGIHPNMVILVAKAD